LPIIDSATILKKELSSSIEINSTPEAVWSVLTDFARFPEWNPFMRWVKGDLKKGSKLEVRIQPSGATGSTFRPTVLNVEPPREIRWIGHLWFAGLFDGEHILGIESIGDNRVRFNQNEIFNGISVRMLARRLDSDTLRGFNEMNSALKSRVEAEIRN
jgi:hypothetical protein